MWDHVLYHFDKVCSLFWVLLGMHVASFYELWDLLLEENIYDKYRKISNVSIIRKNKTELNSVLEPIHFAIFSSQFNYSQYYHTLSTINPKLCKIPKYFTRSENMKQSPHIFPSAVMLLEMYSIRYISIKEIQLS